MALKAPFATAATLIICPILALVGYRHWLATRTFQPLDMPISLSRGHIRTPDFYINLEGEYDASISVDPTAAYAPGCQSEAWESLRAHFVAYENGANVGETDWPRYDVVGILAADKKGYYSLDIEVLSDATCLNSAHPRLTVWNASAFPYDDLYQAGLWIVPIPVVAGLGLLGYVLLVGARRKPQMSSVVDRESLRTTTALEPLTLPESSPISSLPHFGLFCATVLGLVVFVMMIMTTPYPSKGFYVSLKVEPNARYDLTPPIIVTIRPDRATLYPDLFVNSKPVEWNGLKDALEEQLKIRPDWVIYVDGDPNLAFAHVAEVIGIAKELNAKVVLLTPTTRRLFEIPLARRKVRR